MFGLYPLQTNVILNQIAGTTFNQENYIEDNAIGNENSVLTTGNIMHNNNFTLSNEIAENSFKASTYSNADYRSYKGYSNNAVIGIRKINFDFNVPEGKT